MFLYLVKILVDSVWRYRRLEMKAPFAPVGMFGSGPGLTGGTNAIVDKVESTAGETVKNKIPSVPHLRLECTDAAFELSLRWMSAMLS